MPDNLPKLDLKTTRQKEAFESGPLDPELLKGFLEDIDNVGLEVDLNQLEPFKVKLGECKPVGVYTGLRLEDSPEGSKPVQEIVLIINPEKFRYTDIPALVLAVQNQYNSWIQEMYGLFSSNPNQTNESDNTDNSLEKRQSNPDPSIIDQISFLEINPALAIARRYIAIIQILAEVLEQNPNQTEAGQNKTEQDIENPQNQASDSTNSKLSLLEANRAELLELKQALEEIVSQYGVSLSVESIPHEKREKIINTITKARNPEQIPVLLRRLMPLVAKNIAEADQQALIYALFERSGAEMLRMTGMSDIIKKFEEEYGNTIQQLQQDLENAKDPDAEAEVQKKIAYFFYILVYQEKYFQFQDDHYKPNQIAIDRFVNCMSCAYILYTLFKKYFGVEIIGCATTSHFFGMLPLANGQFFTLDGIPKVLLDNKRNPVTNLQPFYPLGNTDYTLVGTQRSFSTGPFAKMHMSAVYNWQSVNIERENPTLAEKFLLKGIELDQCNAQHWIKLGQLYSRFPESFVGVGFGSEEEVLRKATECYKKGINLDPNNYAIYNNLGNLYMRYHPSLTTGHICASTTEVLQEAEKNFLKALEKAGEGNEHYHLIQINLAYLYQIMGQLEKSVELYQEVLDTLEKDPENMIISTDELQQVITELKAKIKERGEKTEAEK
jgi:tetratricopeptide (TPR) repeat protein